ASTALASLGDSTHLAAANALRAEIWQTRHDLSVAAFGTGAVAFVLGGLVAARARRRRRTAPPLRLPAQEAAPWL
ncbi:MAG TPA: hypothetical protein VM536_07010, partial [Chloroflexia bacterium]|nr:hypothetical protein [Chloroflexia bacterium]